MADSSSQTQNSVWNTSERTVPELWQAGSIRNTHNRSPADELRNKRLELGLCMSPFNSLQMKGFLYLIWKCAYSDTINLESQDHRHIELFRVEKTFKIIEYT